MINYKCSAVGATLCYLLSATFGHRLVKKFFPNRLSALRLKVIIIIIIIIAGHCDYTFFRSEATALTC